jgi:hypothetical protein
MPRQISVAESAQVVIAGLHSKLAEAKKEHDEFVEELSVFVPESYDGDGSAESCILQWAKDVDTLAGIVSRLTSPYR